MLPDSRRVVEIMRAVAASEIMPRFRRLTTSDVAAKKGPLDVVTIADVEAERALSAALTALLPGSTVVGEEGADASPDVLTALDGADPVWVIDPVDGTLNFAEGRACFAVIVALCRRGETLAGWILDPVAGIAVGAAVGEGAWIDDGGSPRPLRLPPPRPIRQMSGSLGRGLGRRVERRRDSGRAEGPANMVKYGCTGREYMELGQGLLDFAQYTRLKPWDHAAGVLIHTEAGGYSRIVETGLPYRAQGRILESTVLLAPDQASWAALHRLLEDARLDAIV
ncbi:MAG: inositol monophosphatase [Rhodospirillales bacterium]|nr:MAG: inositol monophosphatase [Rhodospirillales bacterium]